MSLKEVLAPCGDFEKGLAAIRGGADALYLGMTDFSARAHAGNFTLEELKDLITICHLRDVKVYVTLNTLLKNDELEKALDLVGELVELSVDALIVQDLGLIYLLRKYYKDLPLHASTQMNVHNLEGALFLESLGFKRVILGRETTLSEMKRIRKHTNLEIEAFVHGALCVSQSGQCYISQQIGGRSGNRGNCAQICRKNYTLYDKNGKCLSEEKAFLSPKDLNLLDEIEELGQVVDSFKIEGRMKSKEYVYSVVKTYKERLKGKKTDDSLLKETSHRDFTKGLAFGDFGKNYGEVSRQKRRGRFVGEISDVKGRRGVYFQEEIKKGDILTFETEKGKILPLTATRDFSKNSFYTEDYLHDGKLESPVLRGQSSELLEEISRELDPISLNFKFTGKLGEKPVLEISDDELKIVVYGEKKLEKAERRSLDEKTIKKQFERLGDTPFSLRKLTVDLEDELFYPVSLLNDLRREGVSKFIKEKVFRNEKKKKIRLNFENYEKRGKKKKIGNEVKIGEVFYSSNKKEETDFYFKLPYFNTKKDYETIYKDLKENPYLKGFLCRNLGDLFFLSENFKDYMIITDFTFNLWNAFSFKLLEEFVDYSCLNIELKERELLDLAHSTKSSLEGIVDDEIVVMTNRFCPFSLVYEACREHCQNCFYNMGFLEDELGKRYKIKRRQNISEISFYKNYKIKNEELKDSLDLWRIGGDIE